MKRILIGTLVGTVIFFAYQSIMWTGGFHSDFSTYTQNQEPVLNALSNHLDAEGLYIIPSADPLSPGYKDEQMQMHTENVGKPWAMIFYHPAMKNVSSTYILTGIFYTFIACLLACMVIYHGSFTTFGSRFFVAMAFALFTLSQGVLDEMNWWSFPWSFIKPQVIDLTVGWAFCSVWIAIYVKK